MSSLEALRMYFVEQEYPYGEPSGMFRLVTGVTKEKDGQIFTLADELYSGLEAVRLASVFRKHGAKSFKI